MIYGNSAAGDLTEHDPGASNAVAERSAEGPEQSGCGRYAGSEHKNHGKAIGRRGGDVGAHAGAQFKREPCSRTNGALEKNISGDLPCPLGEIQAQDLCLMKRK